MYVYIRTHFFSVKSQILFFTNHVYIIYTYVPHKYIYRSLTIYMYVYNVYIYTLYNIINVMSMMGKVVEYAASGARQAEIEQPIYTACNTTIIIIIFQLSIEASAFVYIKCIHKRTCELVRDIIILFNHIQKFDTHFILLVRCDVRGLGFSLLLLFFEEAMFSVCPYKLPTPQRVTFLFMRILRERYNMKEDRKNELEP